MVRGATPRVCTTRAHSNHMRRAANALTMDGPGVAALLRGLKINAGLRSIFERNSVLDAELACFYRVSHIRCVTRTRVMCQAGRARAAGARARCHVIAWLCERAPLWVVVHVCALLRD